MLDTIKTDEFVEFGLSGLRQKIEESLEGEVLFIFGPVVEELGDTVRADVEALKKRKGGDLKQRLIVLIETPGGYIEVVERICEVFRHHFEIVDFIIPNFAYSAGTVLVLSGDAIYMDYYSVLGPIDPQQVNSEGRLVPLMGYLHQYNALIEKSRKGTLTEAELFYLAKRFDPAEMFNIMQAREHSMELIRGWLVEYKFKDWKTTETQRKPVTLRLKRYRARRIADVLGDAERWHSHGRGIPMRELQSDKIGLRIIDYGKDGLLSEAIHQYYDLLKDYYRKQGVTLALHSSNGLRYLR